MATYSPTARLTMRAIATRSSPMMSLVMPGGLEPVTTSSGFAIPRRGRSGDVRNDRSRRPRSDLGACGCRDFGDVGAAPRASCWARIVSCYLKAEAAPPSASDVPLMMDLDSV